MFSATIHDVTELRLKACDFGDFRTLNIDVRAGRWASLPNGHDATNDFKVITSTIPFAALEAAAEAFNDALAIHTAAAALGKEAARTLAAELKAQADDDPNFDPDELAPNEFVRPNGQFGVGA